MGSVDEHNPSLWVATSADGGDHRPIAGERFDVVVVGAGITGLTTARLLAAGGAQVAVLEAGSIAAGATGYTTAKVTALQRTTLSDIRSRLGEERAAAYAAANSAAVEKVAELVESDGISCELERAPACTYSTDVDGSAGVAAEHAAAQAAGLSTRLDTSTELPFEVEAAVWLDDQLQLHPRLYCLGLVEAVRGAGGTVADHLRVLDVEEDASGCTVVTEEVSIRADHVVVASHLPFLDAGAFFARAHPYRSYALAARLEGPRVRGMYISSGSPTRSIRSTAEGWTVIGGEGHKVGHDDDTSERYAALEGWARETFDVAEIGYRWSAQDYETLDGMPYVGRLTGSHERIWVATGFRKWGMSNGTAAAVIISEAIAGRQSPWAEAYDSTRLAPGASIKSLVTENLDVAKRFVGDHIHALRPMSVEDLAPGEGAIVDQDGETVAAYRDDAGVVHAVTATCTHLGCRVTFNTAERSWDCPCHGSRFDLEGRVLQGPAVEDLARRDVP